IHYKNIYLVKQMDTNIAENELIVKAQNGDIVSEGNVLKQYAPLVKSIARSFYIIGADGDDLIQLGMIGLMRAVRTFSTEGAASFKTYASHCIRNSILDDIRRQKKEQDQTIDIDDVFIPSIEQEPERIYIEDEALRILIDAIGAVLSELEMEVLMLYLEARSYAEISEKLGIEKKQVDNTLYSVKKKIKKLLDKKTV
ncbi:MAG: sigma-70 family RNA polymerase sigma factor, partial [Clostridia bacterium]|nr:sigma-70 family RNA polymerase sigma factor [Clostridia bacterium]